VRRAYLALCRTRRQFTSDFRARHARAQVALLFRSVESGRAETSFLLMMRAFLMVQRLFVLVEGAADVGVERCRSIGERFVGSARAGRVAALAALSALFVLLKAPGATQSPAAAA
jgi:hypothetical protein